MNDDDSAGKRTRFANLRRIGDTMAKGPVGPRGDLYLVVLCSRGSPVCVIQGTRGLRGSNPCRYARGENTWKSCEIQINITDVLERVRQWTDVPT